MQILFFSLPIFDIPAGELISFKNWVFYFRFADG